MQERQTGLDEDGAMTSTVVVAEAYGLEYQWRPLALTLIETAQTQWR